MVQVDTCRNWGGRRPGAGRKPKGPRRMVPHVMRPEVSLRYPVHVTVRVKKGVWNLRSRRSMRVIERALYVARDRFGLRITHVSIQGNHIHMIVEAMDKAALSRAMQGLLVRLAKGLNRMMGRSGKVLEDRFHAHVLLTRRAVWNAVRYVLENRRIHLERLGEFVRNHFDRFAAGPGFEIPATAARPIVAPPSGWLLRTISSEIASRFSRNPAPT